MVHSEKCFEGKNQTVVQNPRDYHTILDDRFGSNIIVESERERRPFLPLQIIIIASQGLHILILYCFKTTKPLPIPIKRVSTNNQSWPSQN